MPWFIIITGITSLIENKDKTDNNKKGGKRTGTYKSKNSASAAAVIWFRMNTINSVSLRRFVSVPERKAWGISWVQNSKTLARVHERSKITQHFLCWKSETCKQSYALLRRQHISWFAFTSIRPMIYSIISQETIRTWFFSCISQTETENSVIVQLRVLNNRLRNAENSISLLIQAPRSSFYTLERENNQLSEATRMTKK